MNRIPLLAAERIDENRYQIKDVDKLNHINLNLKLKQNETCKVFVLDQGLYLANISQINSELCELELKEAQAGLHLDWRLSVGFCRPPSMEKILEHATTYGISQFEFFRAQLSDKSFEQSKLFRDERYHKFLIAGLAQANCFYRLPEVKLVKAQQLPVPSCEQAYMLSPFTQKTWQDYSPDFAQPLHLSIGPERGWGEKEVNDLQKIGWKAVGLGPVTLRVEQACFAACSQLHLLRMLAAKNLA